MEDAFSPTEREAWSGFLMTYAHMNRLIEADLQAHAQLSHVEFEILLRLFLVEGRRMRLHDLTAQRILSQSGISRVIERLERAGFVQREEANEDRRGAYAILTEAGAERFRVAATQHMAFVRTIFLSRFTEAELQQMARFWKRLREDTADTSGT